MSVVREVVVVVAILVLVVACADNAGGDQPAEIPTVTATSTPESIPTATVAPTTTIPGVPTLVGRAPGGSAEEISPPLAQMTAATGTQEAALGTYCWSEAGHGLCVDFTGLPVPEEVLTVTSGERLTVAIPGISQIANVRVDVYNFAESEDMGGERLITYPPPLALDVPYEDDGAVVSIVADLPPGAYVVSASIDVPAEDPSFLVAEESRPVVRGGAVYGFHIEIIGA